MLVFWKAKLVLLAVPKTGTTALEHALLPHADIAFLNPPRLKHMTVRRFRTRLAQVLDIDEPGFELMAVMREPVDWLSSWHRYRSRPALTGQPQSTSGIGFADFVEAWLLDEPPDFAQVGRQSRFLSDATGNLGVDHLFRHDRLQDALDFLSGRVGATADLERLNVSPGRPDTDLPPDTLHRLRDRAARDFAIWDRLVSG
jgi:hypothetical protein